MISVYTIVNKPVPSNCFVVYNKAVNNECIIVDPGSRRDDDLFDFLKESSLLPKYIILTHEHFDHCWGVNEFVERYNTPIVCSALCAECIQNEKRNCSVFYNYNESFVIKHPAIHADTIGFNLPFGTSCIRFVVTPGHSDASICFTIGKCLFTGDTLIKNTRTVTKLPTGSAEKIKYSLDILSSMKGEGLMVYPGHGDSFTFDNYVLERAL